jgi:hypothetical protein
MSAKKPARRPKPSDDKAGQSKVTVVGKAGRPKYGRSTSSPLRGKAVTATTTTLRGDFPSSGAEGRSRTVPQRTDTGRVQNIPRQTQQAAAAIPRALQNAGEYDYRQRTTQTTRATSRAAAQKAMRNAAARTAAQQRKTGRNPTVKGRAVRTGYGTGVGRYSMRKPG